jgi:hypothetical protein
LSSAVEQEVGAGASLGGGTLVPAPAFRVEIDDAVLFKS